MSNRCVDSGGRLNNQAEFEDALERHRVELTRYCCSNLGSWFEAEDAVQETMVRAWRSHDRFEGRSPLRTWLYRIATNVCIDILNRRRRHAVPIGLSSERSRRDESSIGDHDEHRELGSGTDVALAVGDPADLVVARESVRIALVLVLHYLTPRQRAALLLREMLACSSTEIADLL